MAGLVIRVGDASSELGPMEGHFRNTICAAWRDDVELDGKIFDCKQPLRGRYVSVEPFQTESSGDQLTLCVVTISTQ